MGAKYIDTHHNGTATPSTVASPRGNGNGNGSTVNTTTRSHLRIDTFQDDESSARNADDLEANDKTADSSERSGDSEKSDDASKARDGQTGGAMAAPPSRALPQTPIIVSGHKNLMFPSSKDLYPDLYDSSDDETHAEPSSMMTTRVFSQKLMKIVYPRVWSELSWKEKLQYVHDQWRNYVIMAYASLVYVSKLK
eukprot:GFYU01004898.1.p1 GENE.GFYU01004898.1~~GFYU01004898.1.p1  ORF type:complete len:195 (-),score=61.40 GFYU01004898.1:178-762(-)